MTNDIRLPAPVWFALVLLPLACSSEDAPGASDAPPPAAPESVAGATTPPDSAEPFRDSGGWDREFVFAGLGADSAVFLPWHVRVLQSGDSARWERTFQLGLEGSWETVAADTLHTLAPGAPWRILPGGPLSVVVEDQDVLSTLVVESPDREIELRPDEFLAEWTRPDGGAMRLFRAGGSLEAAEGTREIEGLLVDLTRAWSPGDAPPGDWIFLHAGAATQFFLEARGPDRTTEWRGWSRIAFQTRPWPEVVVEWDETRTFEQARRDIPGGWILGSGDAFEGELEVVSSHLVAGRGPGPLLPVSAIFQVRGEVRVEGELISVTGIVRHVQR